MDLSTIQSVTWRANPGACPICTPLDGMTWPITEPPLEDAGAVHPHCQCYYEYSDTVPDDTLGIDEYEAFRRDWAGQWLRDHPPVTPRHFGWTDSLTRVANFNPSGYLLDTPAELLANETYMVGGLYAAGAIMAPQAKDDRAPGTTIEEWGYE